MSSPKASRLDLVFGVAVATLFAAGAYSLLSSREIDRTGQWVVRSEDVLATLVRVRGELEALAGEERAFLRSGDPAALGAIHGRTARIRAQVADLRRLTIDDARQLPRVASLDAQLSRRLHDVAQDSARLVGSGAARVLASSSDSARLIGASLMRAIQRLEDEERSLLRERAEEARTQARNLAIIAFGCLLVAIVLGSAAYLALRRAYVARERAEQTLRDLSLIDELTGLYNRRGFLTLAQRQFKLGRRLRHELLLLFIDMDDFKAINDTFGHHEGDLALQRAAQILRKTFRDSDVLARMGGDEFVVLATDTPRANRDSIITRLRSELRDRNDRDGFPYTLSFSVGVAHFDPKAPPTIEELLRTADAMLYEQKKQKLPPRRTA